MIALAAGTTVFANQEFEINKENCNLPIQEIRKLVPERSKQQEIYQQCMRKAAEEKWLQEQPSSN